MSDTMQLDFDLHGGPKRAEEPQVHSVSELTRKIRSVIERNVGEVWVQGEVSNHRRQASGHQYFTLKDASSQLTCVLFSGNAAAQRGITIADGLRVQIFGEVTVYEARGQYQMIVRAVRNRGEGELQARFEALKQKLAAEGLFAAERKRPMPRFPRQIGLVTSPTGAAVRDFLNVLHRRHPGIAVIINPVRVQGKGAAAEIAQAIGEFSEPAKHGLPAVDVVVVTRGGGSMEDLWEFNEEAVARAIAASKVPVLSAIGHEIDFTISDFAADLRAATPSAAAELLAADRTEVLARLRRDGARLHRAWVARREMLTLRLHALRQSPLLREPERRVREWRQSLDRQEHRLGQSAALAVERGKSRLQRTASRLARHSPDAAIADVRHQLLGAARRFPEIFHREIAARQARLDRAAGVLNALNPGATLARGYTITLQPDGTPITSSAGIAPGASLRTRFSDGEVISVVE